MVGKSRTDKAVESIEKDEDIESVNALMVLIGVLNGKADEIISLLKVLVKKNNKPVKTISHPPKEDSEKEGK